jgi:UDP-2,3-diacylglucosamine pyrophosphatase LpxH
MAGRAAPPDIPDLLTIEVPPGTRVMVISDIHLRPTRTDASTWAAGELSRRIGGWEGPGILVMAGDILELWAIQPADPAGSLAAHPELVEAVRTFGQGDGRRVVYLVGNHDGRIGWDEGAAAVIERGLGAELAFAAELRGPGGTVRVEHGHRFDPANAFTDPRSPQDSPLGQHIVQELLPTLSGAEEHGKRRWLDGVESLSDPRTFPAFVSSRIFYRRLAAKAWWFVLPLALAILLRIPLTYALLGGRTLDLGPFSHRLLLLDLAVVLDIVVVAAILFWGVRRSWKAASTIVAERRGRAQNDNSREAARDLVGKGFAGLVAAHTHHPELSAVEGGFYANTGSGTRVVDRVEARLALPHVFVPRIQLSWVELEPEERWRVRLLAGRHDVPGTTALERRMAKRGALAPRELGVVGEHP